MPDSPLPPDLQAALDALPAAEATATARLWTLASPPDCPDCPPERVDALWARLERARHHADHDPPRPISFADRYERPATVRASPLRRRLKWASPVLALALIAAGWWITPVTLDTVGTHVLPDGSTASLSPGATLSFSRTSGRAMTMTGQATFDVVSNPDVPFVVTTPSARIHVLGTLFTVATTHDGQTRVDVSHGRVAVATLNETAKVELQEGQYTRVTGSTLSRVATSPVVAMSRVDADNVLLGAFLDSLGTRYGIQIQLPDSLRQRPWTLHLDGPVTLDDALGAVGAPLNLAWDRDSIGNVTYRAR